MVFIEVNPSNPSTMRLSNANIHDPVETLVNLVIIPRRDYLIELVFQFHSKNNDLVSQMACVLTIAGIGCEV